MSRRSLGDYGENLAALFLEKRGFKIIDRNWQTRWGEIDIIAQRDDHLHFVEVKTRSFPNYGEGEEAIHRFKKQRLLGAAKMYLAGHQIKAIYFQVDSISILINSYKKTARIRYIPNIALER